jgi:hypothetical protein
MSRKAKMSDCHPDRPNAGHGMCQSCYTKNYNSTLRNSGMCVCCAQKEAVTYVDSRNTIKYCEECRAKINLARSQNRIEQKIEVLSHYGKNGQLQCCWEDCLVIDTDMLSLDHIDNSGNTDRKRKGSYTGGISFYKKLKRQGYPEGFQTLCHNHQWKKEILRRRSDINGTPTWRR